LPEEAQKPLQEFTAISTESTALSLNNNHYKTSLQALPEGYNIDMDFAHSTTSNRINRFPSCSSLSCSKEAASFKFLEYEMHLTLCVKCIFVYGLILQIKPGGYFYVTTPRFKLVSTV